MISGDIIDKISATGLIASCHPLNEASTVNLITASYKGGLRVFEMKHHREDRSFDLFKKTNERTKKLENLVIGAGCVPNARSAETYLQNGARFIVSPFLKKDMAAVCRDYEGLWIPGCTNMNDVASAAEMGAGVVTILSSTLLGVNFFKDIHEHFPEMELIPSQGISGNEKDLVKWYNSGILCVRMPNELFSRESVQLKDWSGIELQVFSLMQRIKRARTSATTFIMKGEDDLPQKD
jgi:2-dehydro-3-deoxyphosphogluconate aldolase / (4S)-4-hydroxy-2-oxoglutarate aldolase